MSHQKLQIDIICGPTASGKTALALKIAGNKPASIISADSRQVYEGRDIITGKDIPRGAIKAKSSLSFHDRPVSYYLSPSPYQGEGRGEVYLWGFDLLKPNESLNAAEFIALTNQIIDHELALGHQVIIVGGTGFYLKALTQPETLAQVPPSEELRQELENLPTGGLQQLLRKIDSHKFLSLNNSDINNPRRLIRAIEIATSPAISIRPSDSIRPISYTWLGLRPPLATIKDNIRHRVISRLEVGAISEVEGLLRDYPDKSLPIYTSLGVTQVVKYLGGQITWNQLVELWIIDEIKYAKRQLTWFKNQPQIDWYK